MTNQEFVFTDTTPTDQKLIDSIETGKGKSPHLRALSAINQSLKATTVLRNKFNDKRESLSAVIERSLPSVIGATNKIKRTSIQNHLVAQGNDKKYVQQTLSRVFRALFPDEAGSKGGKKASPAVIKFVSEQLAQEGADASALKKFYRAVSTELGKVADIQEASGEEVQDWQG